MTLDPETCYAAVQSRDPRFDGRFFTGVRTTGVYCRPVCPARTPKRENMTFYPSASAAEVAGFRPCLRCRPEASPGTGAWPGAPTTVIRALRLIDEGALDEAGIGRLAERLGTTPRHLRRLFRRHLGAPPTAIAQTRRAHFAKSLLDTTTLPVSEVALCAGYRSIRRFNAAFRSSFGRPPSAVRRERASGAADAPVALELRLAYRPPLDWEVLRSFYSSHALPGVEVVDADAICRTVRLDGGAGVLEIRRDPLRSELVVSLPARVSGSLLHVKARLERMFDLRSAPDIIARHLQLDELLATVVTAHVGLRVPGWWDPFEAAVRTVLGQGVSVAAANTLAGRLVLRCGDALPGATHPGLTHLFPTPEQVASADLVGLGAPRRRIDAVRMLARAVAGGELRFDAFEGLDDAVERLCGVPGIGPWTAHYVALRALGEPDAFPAGDLVLRRVASRLAGTELSQAELAARAERWRPWRAYAATALWDLARAHAQARAAA